LTWKGLHQTTKKITLEFIVKGKLNDQIRDSIYRNSALKVITLRRDDDHLTAIRVTVGYVDALQGVRSTGPAQHAAVHRLLSEVLAGK